MFVDEKAPADKELFCSIKFATSLVYSVGKVFLLRLKEYNPSTLKGDFEKIRKEMSSSPTSINKCNSTFLSADGSILNAIFKA